MASKELFLSDSHEGQTPFQSQETDEVYILRVGELTNETIQEIAQRCNGTLESSRSNKIITTGNSQIDFTLQEVTDTNGQPLQRVRFIRFGLPSHVNSSGHVVSVNQIVVDHQALVLFNRTEVAFIGYPRPATEEPLSFLVSGVLLSRNNITTHTQTFNKEMFLKSPLLPLFQRFPRV